MHEDSVIAEVRRIKEAIAAEYKYDVRTLAAALRREQEQRKKDIVHLPSQEADNSSKR